jgi:hypothetical protein
MQDAPMSTLTPSRDFSVGEPAQTLLEEGYPAGYQNPKKPEHEVFVRKPGTTLQGFELKKGVVVHV